jgi:protein-S-isoprenylcysteine O-methyltransferase Ste14
MMTTPSPDTSGVRVFPPLIYAGLFSVGYTADRLAPMHLFVSLPPAVRLVGWGLVALALLVSGSAAFLMFRAGTTPNPRRPTTALVAHGPYRFTRNPMYLGLALLYLGLAVLVNSAWPLALFPVAIMLVERWVISREEAYLERLFGDAYRAYKARVRRWL